MRSEIITIWPRSVYSAYVCVSQYLQITKPFNFDPLFIFDLKIFQFKLFASPLLKVKPPFRINCPTDEKNKQNKRS